MSASPDTPARRSKRAKKSPQRLDPSPPTDPALAAVLQALSASAHAAVAMLDKGKRPAASVGAGPADAVDGDFMMQEAHRQIEADAEKRGDSAEAQRKRHAAFNRRWGKFTDEDGDEEHLDPNKDTISADLTVPFNGDWRIDDVAKKAAQEIFKAIQETGEKLGLHDQPLAVIAGAADAAHNDNLTHVLSTNDLTEKQLQDALTRLVRKQMNIGRTSDGWEEHEYTRVDFHIYRRPGNQLPAVNGIGRVVQVPFVVAQECDENNVEADCLFHALRGACVKEGLQMPDIAEMKRIAGYDDNPESEDFTGGANEKHVEALARHFNLTVIAHTAARDVWWRSNFVAETQHPDRKNKHSTKRTTVHLVWAQGHCWAASNKDIAKRWDVVKKDSPLLWTHEEWSVARLKQGMPKVLTASKVAKGAKHTIKDGDVKVVCEVRETIYKTLSAFTQLTAATFAEHTRIIVVDDETLSSNANYDAREGVMGSVAALCRQEGWLMSQSGYGAELPGNRHVRSIEGFGSVPPPLTGDVLEASGLRNVNTAKSAAFALWLQLDKPEIEHIANSVAYHQIAATHAGGWQLRLSSDKRPKRVVKWDVRKAYRSAMREPVPVGQPAFYNVNLPWAEFKAAVDNRDVAGVTAWSFLCVNFRRPDASNPMTPFPWGRLLNGDNIMLPSIAVERLAEAGYVVTVLWGWFFPDARPVFPYFLEHIKAKERAAATPTQRGLWKSLPNSLVGGLNSKQTGYQTYLSTSELETAAFVTSKFVEDITLLSSAPIATPAGPDVQTLIKFRSVDPWRHARAPTAPHIYAWIVARANILMHRALSWMQENGCKVLGTRVDSIWAGMDETQEAAFKTLFGGEAEGKFRREYTLAPRTIRDPYGDLMHFWVDDKGKRVTNLDNRAPPSSRTWEWSQRQQIGTWTTMYSPEVQLMVTGPPAIAPVEVRDSEHFKQLIREGRQNLVLEGAAGTGKTTLLSALQAEHGGAVTLCATTGVAAKLLGAHTMHSTLGLRPHVSWRTCAGELREDKRDAVSSLRTLIIDEASQLGGKLLSDVDMFLRDVRKSTSWFGGVQVVLVGDWAAQLPPVGDNWCYDVPCYTLAGFSRLELTHIYRQDEPEWIAVLTALRRDEPDCVENAIAFVQEYGAPRELEGELWLAHQGKEQVGVINDAAWRDYEADERMEGSDRFRQVFCWDLQHADDVVDARMRLTAQLHKMRLSEKHLFGQHQMVMLRENTQGFKNGEIVEIEDVRLDERSPHITVNTDDDYDVRLRRSTQRDHPGYGKVLYWPFVPCAGVTIHKAQGQTRPVNIWWAPHKVCSPDDKRRLLYTALSRARKVEYVYFTTRYRAPAEGEDDSE